MTSQKPDRVLPKVIIERDDLQGLLEALKSQGYQTIGPTVQNNAVVYDEIAQVDDLPAGWVDRQSGGKYGLTRHKKKSLFAYVVGPHTWKRFLYPVEKTLLEARREGRKIEISIPNEDPLRQAFIGVRSCELHAMAIQDKVFLQGPYVDNTYATRRRGLFVVAVNCVRAGGTCFCTSMGTGPKVSSGFDLALTEMAEDDRHYFVVEIGTAAGRDILKRVPHTEAAGSDVDAAERAIKQAASRMGREIDLTGLPEVLNRNFENPEWEKVTGRCLTCGNCTLVCPTCFCSTVEDTTDLSGGNAQRRRKWDSCFTVDFSYIHGGSIRSSAMSRYRQWMMHKLAYWPEQFGTSGCVGCGRCITWCPVGIDLTEEARIIRNSE